MATLSSASTLAQVKAAYDDNASYEEVGSVAKARAFVTAARILLRRMPASAGAGGAYVSLSPTTIRDELHAAQTWLASHADVDAGGGGVRAISLESFR